MIVVIVVVVVVVVIVVIVVMVVMVVMVVIVAHDPWFGSLQPQLWRNGAIRKTVKDSTLQQLCVLFGDRLRNVHNQCLAT